MRIGRSARTRRRPLGSRPAKLARAPCQLPILDLAATEDDGLARISGPHRRDQRGAVNGSTRKQVFGEIEAWHCWPLAVSSLGPGFDVIVMPPGEKENGRRRGGVRVTRGRGGACPRSQDNVAEELGAECQSPILVSPPEQPHVILYLQPLLRTSPALPTTGRFLRALSRPSPPKSAPTSTTPDAVSSGANRAILAGLQGPVHPEERDVRTTAQATRSRGMTVLMNLHTDSTCKNTHLWDSPKRAKTVP